MTFLSRVALAVTCVAMLAASGCGAVGGGPKKVVINERVCASVSFLRMTVGETSRVVLDASGGSEGAQSMSFRMEDFPLAVKGDIPPNSTLGDPYSTITLTAQTGEEKSVDVVPTLAGNYTAVCGVVTAGRVVAKDISFQILPKG
jgi:hypothetical protein